MILDSIIKLSSKYKNCIKLVIYNFDYDNIETYLRTSFNI